MPSGKPQIIKPLFDTADFKTVKCWVFRKSAHKMHSTGVNMLMECIFLYYSIPLLALDHISFLTSSTAITNFFLYWFSCALPLSWISQEREPLECSMYVYRRSLGTRDSTMSGALPRICWYLLDLVNFCPVGVSQKETSDSSLI